MFQFCRTLRCRPTVPLCNYHFWKSAKSDIYIPFQLGVSSHESATPVKLIHNAVGHLNGPARTIGSAIIGYLGECVCVCAVFIRTVEICEDFLQNKTFEKFINGQWKGTAQLLQ